ncbi:MAG: hypothetical protein ACLRWH_04960 [Emergencia sp.]|nr:hypothetical protein [Emergencia sp.]
MNKHTKLLISTVFYGIGLVCFALFFFKDQSVFMFAGLVFAVIGWFFKWLFNR